MTLKLNSTGDAVKELQRFLGIVPDGVFGMITENAVKDWQTKNGLKADGIVGPKTWAAMAIATTDNSENITAYTPQPAIHQHLLATDEFFAGPTAKEWLFLHHTAGWHNPYAVITDWGKDTRGQIATEFVIGGESIKGNDIRFDGEIVQAFPAGGYAWHLGIGNTPMHRNSIGIELCNFGQLTQDGFTKQVNGSSMWCPMKKGMFYTYVGTEVHPQQVVKLPLPFKGFKFWHRYSNNQLISLKELILYIANRDSINVRSGLPQLLKKEGEKAFGMCNVNQVNAQPGLWCHANVSASKVDLYPQPELMDMLLAL